MRTLLGTPDPDKIRQGRYQAVADSLVLPLGLLAQALDRARRLGGRDGR